MKQLYQKGNVLTPGLESDSGLECIHQVQDSQKCSVGQPFIGHTFRKQFLKHSIIDF